MLIGSKQRLSTFHDPSSLVSLMIKGTKRLVSVNICSVKGNSASIFLTKMSPGIFVIKIKRMIIIFGRVKLRFGCDKSPVTIFGRQISAANFVE